MNDVMALRSAVIEITNACNLRCDHCASGSGPVRDHELSREELRQLFLSLRWLGGEQITILGGEPLLRPDWPEICRYVNDFGMQLVLITNGIMVGPTERRLLRDLKPHTIGISIDGATRASYREQRGGDHFDQVVSLLRTLMEDGHPRVTAITTLSRRNVYDFDAFADLFEGSGIAWQVQIAGRGGKRFDDNLFIDRQEYAWLVGKMKDAFLNRPALRLVSMDDFGYYPMDPTLRFLHETWRGCIAGRELIGIRSNGDILGCLSMGDEFVEANVRTVDLKRFWTDPESFPRFRNKAGLLTGNCKGCPYGDRCLAGCSSIAWSATGQLGCNPYCIRSLESDDVLSTLDRLTVGRTPRE